MHTWLVHSQHTVLRYLRQPGAPVTVSPHRVLRYGAGRVDRVAWAGGVDSEVVGPVPAPAMSGSTRASVTRSEAVEDSLASPLSGP